MGGETILSVVSYLLSRNLFIMKSRQSMKSTISVESLESSLLMLGKLNSTWAMIRTGTVSADFLDMLLSKTPVAAKSERFQWYWEIMRVCEELRAERNGAELSL